MRHVNRSHQNAKIRQPLAPAGARHPRKIQRAWAELTRFRPIIGGGLAGDTGPRRQAAAFVVVEHLSTDRNIKRERYERSTQEN